jgi:hypothetical protein
MAYRGQVAALNSGDACECAAKPSEIHFAGKISKNLLHAGRAFPIFDVPFPGKRATAQFS